MNAEVKGHGKYRGAMHETIPHLGGPSCKMWLLEVDDPWQLSFTAHRPADGKMHWLLSSTKATIMEALWAPGARCPPVLSVRKLAQAGADGLWLHLHDLCGMGHGQSFEHKALSDEDVVHESDPRWTQGAWALRLGQSPPSLQACIKA